ncbi:LPXTG-motif cell wall-anchored protein [Flavobacterium sp. CG_23.5]|nr:MULTISPECIES: hypothetical protein [unclassified Flavobacterium]MBG6110440.1 LPXTG-motif cell wall-anchored protein [Flavobacterium sp. CG_9.10]MBP2284133.1 LPXTG-motif cell wall-anchored protein [Flavobacterium sp. CG_23.5]
MHDSDNNGMHMDGYSFMGMQMYWLVLIIVLLVFILVMFSRFRKRK